jgi:Holliday junction resolvasome RuvABC endonuclease subunit
MNILAIDPGNIESAYVLMDEHYKPIQFGKTGNENMLEIIEETMPDIVVIEMVASYGMAVGESVFETVFWIGRFYEASIREWIKCARVYRKDVKMNLCGQTRAKDSNIRQALIDRFAKHDLRTEREQRKPGLVLRV